MASEDIAVTKFREYIRIDTEQPEPDYEKAYKFLQDYAKELELEVKRSEVIPGRPMVILKLQGTKPELKSLMLYSHMDVVPTFKDQWKYDPYSAHKEDNGRIYGRGTQDMKCVGIQYLEAYRRLKKAGKKNFTRTIYFVFGADEETGGQAMQLFLKSQDFKDLNLGFTLDEGLASEDDSYKVYYAERCVFWVVVSCKGSPGHGSRFIENDAGSKLRKVINSFYTFREEQKAKLENSGGKLKLGDVTTANLTKIEGGVQANVVPDEIKAYFDVRVTPSMLDEMDENIKKWCSEAGPDVTYTFLQHGLVKTTTPTTDDDAFWKAFSTTLKQENCKFETEIFIGATDSRYLRELGYRSIGFSPMNNTPILLHDHNEYLDESVFLRGIEIYEKLIPNLANVEAENEP
uniref:N-acyl-aliphatic-L-amino acid amidohydrolase n=1 Tax=Panagrolaimus sp. PS1159 TaxID=55785 RepID=A0AC35GL77_9BILA